MNIELYGAMTDLENYDKADDTNTDVFLCFDNDQPMTEEWARRQELDMMIERAISLQVLEYLDALDRLEVTG